LWLSATLEGVGSARALDYLCTHHHAFRWLCGGVSVNYHSLSDFRVQHLEFLDDLLTHSVAVLREQALVDLNRVAQDGLRVRASAGAASFRRQRTLEEHLEEARDQVARLKEEMDDDPSAPSRRHAAARERAAREREERVRQALARLPELAAKKKPADKDKARASTTDPEATVMKMADGGFRPAFNAELATDTASQVIVGVALTNQGTDQGQAAPLEEQMAGRAGRHPKEYLVDGGFTKLEDIVTLAGRGVTVYTPTRPPKGEQRRDDPTLPRPTDPPEVAAWRARMATEEGKATYKDRAAASECVNAQVEGRYGLRQFRVRGADKALAVLTLVAVAHNLLRWIALTT
jgi:hypothetical protein